jgi:hypothetical protein
MKTKKFSKKLVLNKKTVANLNGNEMNLIYGGAPETYQKTVCFTDCETNCYMCDYTIRSRCCP